MATLDCTALDPVPQDFLEGLAPWEHSASRWLVEALTGSQAGSLVYDSGWRDPEEEHLVPLGYLRGGRSYRFWVAYADGCGAWTCSSHDLWLPRLPGPPGHVLVCPLPVAPGWPCPVPLVRLELVPLEMQLSAPDPLEMAILDTQPVPLVEDPCGRYMFW